MGKQGEFYRVINLMTKVNLDVLVLLDDNYYE